MLNGIGSGSRRRIAHIILDDFRLAKTGGSIRNAAVFAALEANSDAEAVVARHFAGSDGVRFPRQHIPTVAEVPEGICQAIVRHLRETRPDAVVFEGVVAMDIVRHVVPLAKEWPLSFIGDNHNVESVLGEASEAQVISVTGRSGRPTAQLWARAREADIAYARLMSRFWVCSRDDADTMTALAGDATPPMDVVANPVPAWCEGMDADLTPRTGPPVLLFVGHLGYPPNIVASLRLCENVLPAIRNRFPDVRLIIAGRKPRPVVIQTALRAGAELFAEVSDLGPLYARATCAVIPLFSGGGTRIKVLEAFAKGLPVVATAKAVEGLEIVPGREYLRAQTPDEFTEAVSRLTADPELAAGLVARGVDYVRRVHSRAALAAAVGASLDALWPAAIAPTRPFR